MSPLRRAPRTGEPPSSGEDETKLDGHPPSGRRLRQPGPKRPRPHCPSSLGEASPTTRSGGGAPVDGGRRSKALKNVNFYDPVLSPQSVAGDEINTGGCAVRRQSLPDQ